MDEAVIYPFARFRSDVAADRAAYAWAPLWKQSGFWVVFSYRLRRLRKHGPGWARALLPLDVLVGALRRFISDTRIPADADIGPGLCLVHSRGIRINAGAVIGAGVRIFHQVTIGEWRGAAPEIGDRCTIYSGARVFGSASLGDGCRIGPNCVVSEDVPAGAIVSVAGFYQTREP